MLFIYINIIIINKYKGIKNKRGGDVNVLMSSADDSNHIVRVGRCFKITEINAIKFESNSHRQEAFTLGTVYLFENDLFMQYIL